MKTTQKDNSPSKNSVFGIGNRQIERQNNPTFLAASSHKTNRLENSIKHSPRMMTQQKKVKRLIPDCAGKGGISPKPIQGKIGLQSQNEDEEPISGKFPAQKITLEDEELKQRKLSDQIKEGDQPNSQTISDSRNGLPADIQAKMERSMNTDFSNVSIHANSPKATEAGALAYTQGSDIHFAPGRFSPSTSQGQRLLGHELAHVVQQREGRVQATTEIAGFPVNDNPALEREADILGDKAANST